MSIATLSNPTGNKQLNSYEFKFITKISEGTEYPVPLLFYKFKSTRTKKTYHVHVEIHPNHFYGLKFFLKDHKKEKDKFSINTNLNEPRPVIYTCINIMLDVLKKESHATFGFIGSPTKKEVIREKGQNRIIKIEEEPEDNTKRFRVYKTILLTFIGSDLFTHQIDIKKSTYLLINKAAQAKNPHLLNEIEDYFSSNFYF